MKRYCHRCSICYELTGGTDPPCVDCGVTLRITDDDSVTAGKCLQCGGDLDDNARANRVYKSLLVGMVKK